VAESRAKGVAFIRPTGECGRSLLPLIFGISTAIAVLLAGVAWLMHARLTRPAVRPPLSAEARDYLAQIAVTDTHMSAAETPLGTTETYLDAHVVNRGSRTVRQLDLQLEFQDMMKQVVLQQVSRPVTENTAPLNPGETRNLHITFDHMPAEWNQGPPVFTPVYVEF
jgi:hypothetical protein